MVGKFPIADLQRMFDLSRSLSPGDEFPELNPTEDFWYTMVETVHPDQLDMAALREMRKLARAHARVGDVEAKRAVRELKALGS